LLKKHNFIKSHNNFTLLDYLFTNASRFADETFVPTNDDILHAQNPTQSSSKMVINDYIHFVDLGGSRTQRKTWATEVVEAQAIIYIAALDDFDLALDEDPEQNRLIESLKLWKFLISREYLRNLPFVLVLNKSDVFVKKIIGVPLAQIFNNYEEFVGNIHESSDYDKGWKYILNQFTEIYSELIKKEDLRYLVTSLIDRNENDAMKVFEMVEQISSPNKL